ncbi:MAG: CD225/dispanin family protein [Candidatus Lernaella stagnicola]|nr:CD225/dispanin family protein [Candidatus Lernaella stagnicola]
MSNENYQPPQPPQPPPAQYYGQPTEHVPFAILTTLFCCMPFGLPAVYFTAKANGQKESGNNAGALESARKGKMWCWVSFGSGLVFWLLYVGLIGFAAMMEGLNF